MHESRMRDYRTERELARDEELDRAYASACGRAIRLIRGWFSKENPDASEAAVTASLATASEPAQPKSAAKTRKSKTTVATAPAAAPAADPAATIETISVFSDGSGRAGGYDDALLRLLTDSAEGVARRAEDLQAQASSVRKALGERAFGDSIMAAQVVRLMVALFWVGSAFWLYQQHVNAQLASSAVTAAGIPVYDAVALRDMFLLLGAVGAIGAFGALMFANLRGRFASDRFVSASELFGRTIAKMLTGFDDDLSRHRERLASASLTNREIADEVARAHVSAHEAALLFQDVGFLIDRREESGRAFAEHSLGLYSGYLNECAMAPRSEVAAAQSDGMLQGGAGGVLIGVFIGMFIAISALNVPPEQLAQELGVTSLSGITNYPLAIVAAMGGAMVYFVADAIADIIAMSFGPVRRERLTQSLATVRGAITSENAPRSRDIAARVEDLAEIFRVRLGNSESKTPGGVTLAAYGARIDRRDSYDADRDDTPEWRKTPEGPRFVETGFQAAPKQWLAGPQGQKNARAARRETGAKRSLFGLKTPRSS